MEIDSKYIAYSVKRRQLCYASLEELGLKYWKIPEFFTIDGKTYKKAVVLEERWDNSESDYNSYFTDNFKEEFRLYK